MPTGPVDMWTRPPFEPWIEGDWLYGRGGADMKAGLCANLAALDALKTLGWQPAARVHVQSVTEEECTGNGALSALVRGYRADAALIPEPEENMLVRANTGVIWFRVHVRGRPVHVREAGQGANAIEAAVSIIPALKTLEREWNDARSVIAILNRWSTRSISISARSLAVTGPLPSRHGVRSMCV